MQTMIYEYECKDCDARFESDVQAKDTEEGVIVCPECGSTETAQVSSFVGRARRSGICAPTSTGGFR